MLHSIPPPSCLREGGSPTRPHLFLGPQVHQGFSTSSPTDIRPGRTLLHMCQGPWTSFSVLLVGGPGSGSSMGSGLVENGDLHMKLLSLPAFNPSLIKKSGFPTSAQLLGVSISFCVSQLLVGPLRGQPHLALFCKHITA